MTNDGWDEDAAADATSLSRYRRALGRIPTSAVVISSMVGGEPAGVAIGTFALVSIRPPLVGFFGDPRSPALSRVLEGDSWCFSVLSQDDLPTLAAFRGPHAPSFDGVSWRVSEHGTPHLDGALLTVDAVPFSVTAAGDHQAVIARVRDVRVGDPSARPLVVQGGRLARLDPGQLLDRDLWQLDVG